MQTVSERFFYSLNQTKNTGHLIHVFLYKGEEWVAHCFGIITSLSEQTLVFRSRGDGSEIQIDLRNLGFQTDVPGFGTYGNTWTLSHPEGWKWNVIDLESVDPTAAGLHKAL